MKENLTRVTVEFKNDVSSIRMRNDMRPIEGGKGACFHVFREREKINPNRNWKIFFT